MRIRSYLSSKKIRHTAGAAEALNCAKMAQPLAAGKIQPNPTKSNQIQPAWFGGLWSFLLLLCALSLSHRAGAQSIYENYTFLTLAGPGKGAPGWFDGPTTAAQFGGPVGIARD